ncbi:MAG: bifunctional chorismate mutase/prephenate dehydratase [Phycisphaeraceae bacterium]|nr:bifunctional chorismate mutase/prephenate dehydratase [Phycisphaeraceae bacterium]MBX3406447.1 bifunctional chorismate mutase/prephenate dehydratase [Phycisphaeraceae bacterium]
MPRRTASKTRAGTENGAARASRTAKKGRAARESAGASAQIDPRALDDLRVKIDEVDRGLIGLLNKRAELVVEVGRIKREAGLPIYVPNREAQVLNKVLAMNPGPLPPRAIEGVYRELMSGSFRLELPLRIGYLGPAGSYSHLAAVKHFGSSVEFDDLRAIGGVFTEVARGHVDYGLVPIENSTFGAIHETLEAFQNFHNDLCVYAEVQLEVHHALLANCAPGQVGKIYSKPEVFGQCRTWLATQYPHAQLIPEASSSAAVMRAARAKPARGKGRTGVAAIGSTLAGELYDVSVLFENIEDNPHNITRFYVLSKHAAKPVGKDDKGRPGDKTAIMFTAANEPGALVNVLSVFHRAGINLTHIDKRPSGRSNWQYTFFIDAEGHVDEAWFAAAIAQVRGMCREMHVLGSFPRSKRIL